MRKMLFAIFAILLVVVMVSSCSSSNSTDSNSNDKIVIEETSPSSQTASVDIMVEENFDDEYTEIGSMI